MAYLMDEISEAATQRRLEEITASGMRALQECADRSAEIDKAALESAARQEAEIRELERVRDELQEARQADQQPAGQPWPSWKPRPSVLSFDAEELAQETTVSATMPTPPMGFTEPAAAIPPPPPEPEPGPPARPAREHVLSFGAEEPDEDTRPRPSPPPSSPPRPGRANREDDDWSDTNWIR